VVHPIIVSPLVRQICHIATVPRAVFATRQNLSDDGDTMRSDRLTDIATDTVPRSMDASRSRVLSEQRSSYYDFYIYGTAAALVFPHVFFPEMSSTMATIASFGTFAAAFFSRPLGAAVIRSFRGSPGPQEDPYRDAVDHGVVDYRRRPCAQRRHHRVGRTNVALTLRLLQGFAVGGEWAGAALLSAEYAPAASAARTGCSLSSASGSAYF
jgi:hypothetical protein